MGGSCGTHEMRNAFKGLVGKNLKRRDHSEDLGVDGKIISERILGKQGGNMQTGCIWLRTGANSGILQTR
jgi:hypothetical protein